MRAPESRAAPAWESRAAETRRPAPTTWSSSPARRLRRRPSRPSSQMQALWTPSTSPISAGGGAHQRLRVAVLQGPLAQPGDDGLLGERPLQLPLGVLALGDVVEDAVPDRHPLVVGLQHRLVEHPDDLAARGCASGTRPAGVAVAEVDPRFRFASGRRAIVGVQEAGPESAVLFELLGGVAEDLLDLGADVAPLAFLAQLRGVDDHRQALDQPPVVLPAGGYLVEEFVDLVLGPVPVPDYLRIAWCIDTWSRRLTARPSRHEVVQARRSRSGGEAERRALAARRGAARPASAPRPGRGTARTARRTPPPRRRRRGGRGRRGGRPA